MLKEFKEFTMRGNVMDFAVGVIIGGAFGKIVGSLVNECDHARNRPASGQCGLQQSVH